MYIFVWLENLFIRVSNHLVPTKNHIKNRKGHKISTNLFSAGGMLINTLLYLKKCYQNWKTLLRLNCPQLKIFSNAKNLNI